MRDPESAAGRDVQRDPTADVPPACEESSDDIVEVPPLALQALALLVAGPVAARMCGVSERTWWKWHSCGLVPKPVSIGATRRRFWSVRELASWCEAGCPSRDRWEAMVEARGSGGNQR